MSYCLTSLTRNTYRIFNLYQRHLHSSLHGFTVESSFGINILKLKVQDSYIFHSFSNSPLIYFERRAIHTKNFCYLNEKSTNEEKKNSHDNGPTSVSTAKRLKGAVVKVLPKKKEKERRDPALSRERNFLTPVRAMTEFLLKPNDLENLRKTKRRSPFENEPPITVYWRKDIESKALEVWGSMEVLRKEKIKQEQQLKEYQDFLVRMRNKFKYNTEEETPKSVDPSDETLSSGRVVWSAVLINGVNFLMKMGACVYTGSHSLFAEALHSLADFTNQLILAYGLHKSKQVATKSHPYGYTTMPYVSSLISGAMIFCIGSGLSIQHGFSGLFHPTEVMSPHWAFYVLGGSLISEGVTLLLAMHTIRQGAKKNQMTFSEYVLRGSDPSVNVVLLEDLAAVMGVGVALSCMGLTTFYGSHIPDAIGSCIVGGILAGVSGFIIYSNTAALTGRSIPEEALETVNNELEADVMIRAVYDVKGIDMGPGLVRYKAEVDFDGRELSRSYLSTQDMDALLAELKQINTKEEIEEFLLCHGEGIVDYLGAEIDRIERALKKEHPEIRHCDLEIL